MRLVLSAVCACLLGACAAPPRERGTLRELETREVAVNSDAAFAADRATAIRAYRRFLDAAPRDRMRPEAMRRLGDLEVERAQDADGRNAGRKDYRGAIRVYEDLLRAYPDRPDNDRVLYQLSHAYDQAGDLARSLAVLDRLVARYPRSVYLDEAEFRRGELLFTLRRYAQAEKAYAVVIGRGASSPFYERALYMHGWSLFKEVRLEEALPSFFAVLDRKLIGRSGDAPLADISGLSRAERELVEDTFRVVTLCLANLHGPDTIPRHFTSPARNEYEFRVYQALGELYFKEERVADAAGTLNAFARRHPAHPQSPLMQSQVIGAYQKAGFAALALEAKKEFVVRYGADSAFRRANPAPVYARVEPLVKTHVEELARHYHAIAQKSRKSEDYREAGRWYRVYVESFPSDPRAAALRFLLAESLFEDRRYAEAALEYEHAAYDTPRHAKSADAGYAALLAYAAQEKTLGGEALRALRERSVRSAGRFADANPKDSRTPGVLANTAEQLFAAGEGRAAAAMARRVIAIEPPATAALRRTAWTVVAHVEFQREVFDRAEQGYREALALTPARAPARAALTERLAASVYKQGEQARKAGRFRAAADHFLRVGGVAPGSPIRANAEYDAGAALIALRDWSAAAQVLEGFRRGYPKHPLQSEVPAKLAACYLESGQTLKAAAAFEAISRSGKDEALSREALWRSAELYEKAGRESGAEAAYERYVRRYPRPLEPAIEARYRLAEICRKTGRTGERQSWSSALLDAEQKGGKERTDRTRYLGSLAALVAAEPLEAAYRNVRLTEPLKKNLRLKKAKLEQTLRAYTVAAEYGVPEVATTATYRTAELYGNFGKALLESQRPKKLSREELEQYNVMLEEQAFPFEEKAIQLHEINVRRVRSGVYDEWVKKSFAALGKLRPARYAKSEKGERVIDALN